MKTVSDTLTQAWTLRNARHDYCKELIDEAN